MSSRKPKSALERERYTAELSTGQLVIGVCILLMFGLGCFLLGVLIGKFDPTLRDQFAGAPSQDLDGPAGRSEAPAEPPRQTIRPPENALPPEVRVPPHLIDQSAPPAAPATDPTTTSGTAGSPGATQSSGSTATTTPAAGTTPPGGETTPVPPPPVAVATDLPPTGQATSPSTNAAAAPPPPADPKPADPKPAVADPPAPKPVVTSAKGIYGVQIIAVARPRAEAVKREVEARSTYKADIIAIDGDRLCKVVVGRFEDERSALRARDDLRRTYRDAFVVPLK